MHVLFTENTLAAAIISGAFNLYISRRVRRAERDIDGVAIKAGTKRALARLEKQTNPKPTGPDSN